MVEVFSRMYKIPAAASLHLSRLEATGSKTRASLQVTRGTTTYDYYSYSSYRSYCIHKGIASSNLEAITIRLEVMGGGSGQLGLPVNKPPATAC